MPGTCHKTPCQKIVFKNDQKSIQSKVQVENWGLCLRQILRSLKDKYAVRGQYQCSCIMNNRDPWLMKLRNLWMLLKMVSWIWQRWSQRVAGTGFRRKYTEKRCSRGAKGCGCVDSFFFPIQIITSYLWNMFDKYISGENENIKRRKGIENVT